MQPGSQSPRGSVDFGGTRCEVLVSTQRARTARDASGSRGHDAGSRGHDAGSRGHDAGSRGHDAGSRGHDAGSFGKASGSRGHASGSPGHASGSPGHDAGSRGHDAGSRGHDAGSRGHDAGSRGHDAGSRGHDAGSRGHDAGSRGHDAGSFGKASGSSGNDAGASCRPTAPKERAWFSNATGSDGAPVRRQQIRPARRRHSMRFARSFEDRALGFGVALPAGMDDPPQETARQPGTEKGAAWREARASRAVWWRSCWR
jgi:hypothetical protein